MVYALNGGTLFALGGYSNFTLTNVSSLTPAVVGQSVTFTTTLASTNGGPVPTGSITYSYTSGVNNPLNSTPVTLGTMSLVNGQSTFTTSSLAPDHYHIIASYSGDTTDGYAAGSTTLVQVVLADPATTVSSSASAITAGTNVTFSATVDPGSAFFVPLGTVSFLNGNTLLGTVGLNPLDQSTSHSSSQVATFTTSALPAGSDSITAVYSGDLNFTGSTSAAITETVNPVPTITTTTLPDWTVSQPYNQTIAVTGGTSPITFAVSSGSLPNGLSLSSSTGAITGTPTTTSGSPFSFTITATDADGVTASQAYKVAINPAPSITTTTLPNWTINQSYSQTIATSGGTAPITFAVTSGGLPTGLSLNSSTGAITGTPSTTSGSPFSFTITATDAAGVTASQAYTVAINPALSISPTSLPVALTGIAYNQVITVSGGTTPYTTFSVTNFNGGTTGLTSSDISTSASAGTVTVNGTPSASGSASFTVNVTDTAGATLTQNYTLTVLNPTTTALTDSGPNPSEGGTAVSFTTTVTPASGPAISGETVNIEDASNGNAVVATPTITNGTATFTISNLSVATHNLFAVYPGDANNAASQSGQVSQVVQSGFQVVSTVATPNGVEIVFNAPVNVSTTHMYNSPSSSLGAPDVTVAGSSTGAVEGSLTFDPSQPWIGYFVKTAGILATDTYQVAVLTAVKDAGGNALGSAYSNNLSVTAPSTPVISIASFARGPGQAVNVPNTASGIPVSIANATNVTSATFSVQYNPTLLTIAASGAVAPSSAANSAGLSTVSYTIASVDANNSILTVTISAGSGNGLTAGSTPVALVDIAATVPYTAPYLSKAELLVSGVSVNSSSATGVSGIDEDAYLGDVLGQKGLNAPGGPRRSAGFDWIGQRLRRLCRPRSDRVLVIPTVRGNLQPRMRCRS